MKLLAIIALIGAITFPQKIDSHTEDYVPTEGNRFIEATVVDEKDESASSSDAVACSCVATAIEFGAILPLKDASQFVPNTEEPIPGGLVLMAYDHGVRHVAVVVEVRESSLLLYEGNYKRCEKGYREVPKDYRRIIGYWIAG